GGSDAQREVVEETRICALLRAGRFPEALQAVDRRLDRRPCRRDEWFRTYAGAGADLAGQALTVTSPPATETCLEASGDDAGPA
ncbi:MAG: hypothetical protein HOQ22_15975, partial [Nocardioidaceae bacterium]|nr:hypothetical protein [Nocardioidaceae bacterium]